MTDYQTRVMTEALELETKLNALRAFLGSERIADISTVQGLLLHCQADAMQSYLNILNFRIGDFKSADL